MTTRQTRYRDPLRSSTSRAPAAAAPHCPYPSTTATTTYHRAQVEGVGIFYREAGPKDAPTIMLVSGISPRPRNITAC